MTCPDARPDTGALRLAAAAASVPSARAFVRAHLAAAGVGETATGRDAVDAAELCASELATNAVVHARTDVELRVEVLGDRIRLEVRDHSKVVPRQVLHSARSTTGRGLDLVRVLAQDWGVTLVEDDGKVVWCELSIGAADAGIDEDALLAAWPDDLDAVPEPITFPVLGRTAVLRGYPVRLGMRHREHTDAVLRECLLIQQAALQSTGTTAPEQLVEVASALTARYSALLSAPERRKQEAFDRGDPCVDLEYPLPAEAETVLVSWRDTFRALDAYAESNDLLTLRTPADIAALREWAVADMLAQAAGAPPTPWDGPLG